MSELPRYRDVLAAAECLRGVAHRTPVLSSRRLDAALGARLYFKAENFQRVGAFKFRGAYHALASLSEAERQRGVVAYSSGNHAQAVALAGQLLSIPTCIVMPADAPAVKLAATRAYGAELRTYDRAREQREAVAAALVAERGATLIPPFDHPRVIAGQGTVAKELIEEVGALDLLVVCVGGGGLISGCALAAHQLCPGIEVIGAEPAGADDAAQSLAAGRIVRHEAPHSIADGALTPSLGTLTFPLVQRLVSRIVTISDATMAAAMRTLMTTLKVVVEPTGALAAAAVLSSAVEVRGRRVGIVLSGGNLDPDRLPEYLALAREAPGWN